MILVSRVTEIPDSEPITLPDMKGYLSVTDDQENALILSLIKAVRRMAEIYTGRSLVTQERTVKLDHFPCYSMSNPYMAIQVPYGPIQSIDEFTYVNTSGVETTLVEGTDFLLDDHNEPALLYAIDTSGDRTSWPSTKNVPNAVSIVYTAGYDDVSGEATPDQAKSAIRRQVKEMFDKREDPNSGIVPFGGSTVELCMSARMMLDSLKVYWNANL